jgi:tetratricopeptide (TPR) repeat protein
MRHKKKTTANRRDFTAEQLAANVSTRSSQAPDATDGVGTRDERAPGSAERRRQQRLIYSLLTLAVLAAFGQSVRFAFVWDDEAYVRNNPAVAAGLTWPGFVWAFTQARMINWHPLTWLSHMADCQLYGMWPGGHHLTSVLLHAAATILLFRMLLELTNSLWPSAFASALFAVHPLRTESVAWVSERKDVLSGLFFVLAIIAYARFARPPRSLFYYFASLALFACGLMSKQMVVTLPCVLLLLDWWPLGRLNADSTNSQPDALSSNSNRNPLPTLVVRCLLEKLPFFALAIGGCCVTIFSQRDEISSSFHLSPQIRVANALVAYMTYIRQFFLPVNLAALYPHLGDSLPTWKVGAAFAALLAISGLAIASRSQRPYLLVGWLWFLGMLVPVIGVVQVGRQSMADRYTYLPQIGLCIAVAWGAAEMARFLSVSRRTLAICGVAVFAVLIYCSWRQSSYWQNAETLWTRTIACTDKNSTAYICLGAALNDQNKVNEAIAQYSLAIDVLSEELAKNAQNKQAMLDEAMARQKLGVALAKLDRNVEAVQQFEMALQLKPNEASIQNDLGNVLVKQGKTNDAISHFEQALEGDSALNAHTNLGFILFKQGQFAAAIGHYQAALRIEPTNALVHHNLANALAEQGKLGEAIYHFERALELNPNDAPAHYSLGNVLVEQGQIAAGIAHFERALSIQPRDAAAHTNLGVALEQQGRSAEAIAHYRTALEIEPNSALPHNNLGVALERQGKVAEAMLHYRRAIELQPDFAGAHYKLANSLAGQGQLEEAIAHYEKTLQVQPRHAGAHVNLGQALAARDQTEAAIEHYRAAISIEPAFAAAQLRLVDALAGQGKLDAAIAECRKGLKVAQAQNRNDWAGALQERLKRFGTDVDASGSQ